MKSSGEAVALSCVGRRKSSEIVSGELAAFSLPVSMATSLAPTEIPEKPLSRSQLASMMPAVTVETGSILLCILAVI